MNRSKVEKIRSEIHAFKGKISPKIVVDWCGRGSGLQGSWERFSWAASWLQSRDEFRFNFASKEATIALDRGHDQAAIGP